MLYSTAGFAKKNHSSPREGGFTMCRLSTAQLHYQIALLRLQLLSAYDAGNDELIHHYSHAIDSCQENLWRAS